MGTKQFDNYADLITFTRASGGTALRPISYGSELVTNGTFDTDISGWTAVNSTLSLSSNALSVADAGSFSAAYQAISTEIGKAYRLSLDCVSKTGGDFVYGWGDAIPDGATYYASQDQVTQTVSGSYTLDFVAVSTTTYISVGSQTTRTAVYDNISVKEVLFDQSNAPLTLFNHPTNIPRIEYDADGNRLGLLVEEQRTNLLTYSEDFSNAAWSKSNVSIDSNTIIAPDGTLTVDKLVEDVSSGLHQLRRVQAVPASSHTFSVYVKKAERTWVRLSLAGSSYNTAYGTYGTNRSAYFDLENGAKGTIGSAFTASTISTIGNDWYRISVTFVGTNDADNENQIAIAQGDLDASAYTGDGYSGIYIWGAQVEAGSFPTSYIPTSGSTATRAADVASITGADFKKWFNPEEGTLYGEASQISSVSNLFALGNSISFYILLRNRADGVTGTPASLFNSSPQVSFSDVTYESLNKSSFAYKINDFAVSVNGATALTDTNGQLPVVTEAQIGGLAGFISSCHIKSIKYYPRRLTNAQLQELTQ